MRIAWFSPYLPYPAVTGGRIRMARLSERLGRLGEVVLFATGKPSVLRDPEVRALNEAAFAGINVGINRLAFLPCSSTPTRAARSDAPALDRAFRAEHRRQSFDAVVVAHSHAAPIALRSGLPVIVDEHNVESDYYAQSAQARGRSPREQARFRAWETHVWRQARLVTAVSEDDAAVIRDRAPSAEVRVVPNGVDGSALRFVPPSARGRSSVLFVGLMSHPPNARAAERLARRIMPRVWAEHPDARLVLCGHNPRPEVRALAAEPRVTVTGTVSDVAPFLAEAAVSVNPLDYGAGTSLKVVEALASGTPLITTSVGIRGYPREIETLCDVANDDRELSDAIARRLGARPDDARARAARAFAERYDWQRLCDRFAELVASASGPLAESRAEDSGPGPCAPTAGKLG